MSTNMFREVAKRVMSDANGDFRKIPNEIIKAIRDDFHKLARELGITKYTVISSENSKKEPVYCGDNFEWTMLKDLYMQMLISSFDIDNLFINYSNPDDIATDLISCEE